jgi:glycosyltransferase involved in cell wall biosynthesis
MAMKLASRLLSRTTHRIDIAQGWGKHMQKAVRRRLADQVYDAVILTVPSFSTLSHFAALAREYPEQRFIVDYRDPWTYFLDDYGRVDTARNRRVMAIESRALESVDEIWVTTVEHQEDYRRRYPFINERLIVIPNGYDPADFTHLPASPQPRPNQIAVCPGTLIRERLETLLNLLLALRDLSLEELRINFRIWVYSSDVPAIDAFGPELAALFRHYVDFKPTVSPSEMARILSEARYGLVLHDQNYTQTVPVKLYDFVAAGCQVIYLGPPTWVSRELAENGHYVAKDDTAAIKELFNQKINSRKEVGLLTSLPKHAIPLLTDRLAERLF